MTLLFGHEEAVGAFRSGLETGRLHHAWLITGPQGIGKALFAEKAALRLLAEKAGPPVDAPGLEVSEDHRIAKLVAAGSHPDLVKLERLTKESGTELARSITVEQVRGLQRLFSTTPSLSPWRVVIVDSIDDLERNGANALLKNLEEPPPNSLFLLVSHSPERLLPTIRSRCRVVRLSPLKSDVMAAALRSSLSDADDDEIMALVASGEGAPGRALAHRGLEIEKLDEAIGQLIAQGDPTNARRVALSQSLSLKSAQPRFEAFLARAPAMMAQEAKTRRGAALAHALALWAKASDLASSARHLSLDPQSTVFELGGLLAAMAPTESRRAA